MNNVPEDENDIDPIEQWFEHKHEPSWWGSMKLAAQQCNPPMNVIDYIHKIILHEQIPVDVIKAQQAVVSDGVGEPGEKIMTGGGSPTKSDLLGKVKQTGVADAFSEFIDNILDNYEQYIPLGVVNDLIVNVSINVEADPIPGENNNGIIVITENSGGVPKNRWDSLIQVGNSNWDAITEAVGTWGNGSKVALATLGRHNLFQTYYFDENNNDGHGAVQMQFGSDENMDSDGGMTNSNTEIKKLPRNYYHEKNDFWKTDISQAIHGHCIGKPGTSAITIKRLTEKSIQTFQDQNKYDKMIETLQKIFYNKIREIRTKYNKNIDIIFNNARLAPCKHNIFENPQGASGDLDSEEKNFVFLPGIKPIRHSCRIAHDDEEEISLEILVGMPLKNDLKTNGFMLWGNGRLFDENFKDFETPLASQYPNWHKGTRVDSGRVKGFVKITGNPSLIPWKGPLKWKFNKNSKFADTFLALLSSLITRYTSTSLSLGRSALIPKEESGPKFLRLFYDEEE